MRIGELAVRSGLSTATIRFYERRGILPGPGRRGNGYREYSDGDLDRTKAFGHFRGIGLEPAVSARLADQCATGRCDATWAELPPLIEAQRVAIGARMRELRALDHRLAALQGAIVTTGQSDHRRSEGRKEDLMLHCDCDGGCCGGPNGPCC